MPRRNAPQRREPLPDPERTDFWFPTEFMDQNGNRYPSSHAIYVEDPPPTPADGVPDDDRDGSEESEESEESSYYDYDEDEFKAETLDALDTFKSLLAPAVECGPVALVFMSYAVVNGEEKKITKPNGGLHFKWKDKTTGKLVELKGEDLKEVKRDKAIILFGAVGLFVVCAVQNILFIGLTLAMVNQMLSYNHTGAPALCPGQTTMETLQAMGVEKFGDYTAGVPENIVMVASIVLIVSLTCCELISSYRAFNRLRDCMEGDLPRAIEKRFQLFLKNNGDARGVQENFTNTLAADLASPDKNSQGPDDKSTRTESTLHLGGLFDDAMDAAIDAAIDHACDPDTPRNVEDEGSPGGDQDSVAVIPNGIRMNPDTSRSMISDKSRSVSDNSSVVTKSVDEMAKAAKEDRLMKAYSKYHTLTWYTFYYGYADLMIHVLLTVIIYGVTLLAIFFMGSAGKMVAAIFAATFVAELDDKMINFVLDNTTLTENLYHLVTPKMPKTQEQPKKKHRHIYKNTSKVWRHLHKVLFHLSGSLFLSVLALAIFLLAWTFRGCKPGTENEFEYF